MGISLTSKGNFEKTTKYLKKCQKALNKGVFDKYGRYGVAALQVATPVDTGLTAASWDYNIVVTSDRITIEFVNTNVNNHVNIAMILQYGHGTRNGGWVEGKDYINPALKPVFESLVKEVWEEVISL
jgi:hypothetical protein